MNKFELLRRYNRKRQFLGSLGKLWSTGNSSYRKSRLQCSFRKMGRYPIIIHFWSWRGSNGSTWLKKNQNTQKCHYPMMICLSQIRIIKNTA